MCLVPRQTAHRNEAAKRGLNPSRHHWHARSMLMINFQAEHTMAHGNPCSRSLARCALQPITDDTPTFESWAFARRAFSVANFEIPNASDQLDRHVNDMGVAYNKVTRLALPKKWLGSENLVCLISMVVLIWTDYCL